MNKWKPIPGFDNYFASKDGFIKSVRVVYKMRNGHNKNRSKIAKEMIISSRPNHNGYLRCSLSRDGKAYYFFVHRLIAVVYIPNPNNNPFINHLNGIKNDNNVKNLEWVTQSQNEIHAHLTGLKNNKGERHPLSKLKNNNIYEIRIRLANGEKATKIAKEFGVSDATISNIKKCIRWGSVK